MTLVVSEVSPFGIVMVGDSALARRDHGKIVEVREGVRKIHYNRDRNVGFATWGKWMVGSTPFDEWIDDFVQSRVHAEDSAEIIGERLAKELNNVLSTMGKPWSQLVRGVHIAGYESGVPFLYHVHCGHNNEPSHELTLYKDFPDDHGYDKETFENSLSLVGAVHLRNGYHPHFGRLFNFVVRYSEFLKLRNISFPQNSLDSRAEFYKFLLNFIAEAFRISGHAPVVNSALSTLAFNQSGAAINDLIPLGGIDLNGSAAFADFE